MTDQNVIESGRAEFALSEVKKVKNDTQIKDDEKRNYKSYAKKYPSLILSNGLAATVVFALEKGGAWEILNRNVADWLVIRELLPEKKPLEEYICSLNSDRYRIVTNEVLSLFEWLRRFASGIIEE
ncbi:MAG: type III-B CRISPR module-associated protein Cmr5 [Clostridiales bacterium]|jgi:CRISPR-associated protein Cmr5|nr:type III-B CRISPR module-associated protein Cmr5 [Clostridiales bacterium]